MDNNDFLKKLDEKFEEKKQQNLQSLQKITSDMRTFTVKICGQEFIAFMPPASIEKEMVDDLQNLQTVEYAKKYLPIVYGLPEEEVEKLPTLYIAELVKAYFEAYKELISEKFRVNPKSKVR